MSSTNDTKETRIECPLQSFVSLCFLFVGPVFIPVLCDCLDEEDVADDPENTFEVDDFIEIQRAVENKWYTSTIVKKRGSKIKIHYDNYDSK